MSQSTFVHPERVGRRRLTGAGFLRAGVWVLVLVLVNACSGERTPTVTPRWDEARWDVARWVVPSDGSASGIAAGNELDAEPLRLALAAVETDVGTLRELVIEVRRTQVRVRDRVAALEVWASGSSALGSVSGGAGRDVRSLESVAGAGLQAGSLASSASLNSVFAVLAGDLVNIHEFMGLLERDSDAIAVRLAAVEDALDVVPAAEDDPVPFDVAPPVVPHAFVTGTVMRAAEMNENLVAVAVTEDFVGAANEMMSRLVDVFLVRIVALEELAGDAP